MKKILILIGRYLPGTKDGGSVRTIQNLTEILGDEVAIRVLTKDRDSGDTVPYPGVSMGEPVKVGKAEVIYSPGNKISQKLILKYARGMDAVMMCGCFNTYCIGALMAKRLGRIQSRFLIFSMGSFDPGAFGIRRTKKRIYMQVLRLLGLLRKVEWIATSEKEAEHIRKVVGRESVCHLAQDPPRAMARVTREESSSVGRLKVVFLSRISQKKNLLGAVRILQGIRSQVDFDIYGFMEEEEYYHCVEKELALLPSNVNWRYCGEVESSKVPEIFARYDVFLFPSFAENYGHVILEAMQSGCLPVISDRTFWTDTLIGKHGAVIPVEMTQKFRDALEGYAQMNADELESIARATIVWADHFTEKSLEKTKQAYRTILEGNLSE